MKRKTITALLLMLLVLGVSGAVFGEPPDDNDEGAPLPSREEMTKVRERIEAMKMWKLTEALDLDQQSAARLFPVLNKYDKQRSDLELGMRQNIRGLKDTLKTGTDGDIKALLTKIEASHKELQKLNEAEIADLKGVLTVRQQAQYLMFKMEFERTMRQTIMKAQERRRDRIHQDFGPGGGPDGGRGGPGGGQMGPGGYGGGPGRGPGGGPGGFGGGSPR